MSRLVISLATTLLCLVAVTACRPTLNVGNGKVSPPGQVILTVPNPARAGEQGTFTLSVAGGTAPYTAVYTFSGCVSPLTYTREVPQSSDSLTVTFLNTQVEQTCSVSVTVTDFAGLSGTGFAAFTVQPSFIEPLYINAVANNATCSVAATVSDADGDDITLTATAPVGMTVLNPVEVVTGGTGTATFRFSPDDIFAGAVGTIYIHGEDGRGATGDASATLTCAPLELLDDTIYAIPTSTTAAVGEPVRILVSTGAMANPFQYLNNVRVTFPNAAGPAYVNNSFDTGAVDDNTDREHPIDGIWADVGASGFLLIGDNFIRMPIDLANSGLPGRTGWDFSISPLDGNDVQVAGILFSFEMTFANPGTVDIGFQRVSTDDNLPRTYYQDDTQGANHQWDDDDNVHNAPNSVEVTP